MDEEEEHSPSEVSIILNMWKLLMQKLKQASSKARRPKTISFINQQKSANTNKKTATDMNTLLRYMEANGMKNEKIESLPASELVTFCRNLFERTEENVEE